MYLAKKISFLLLLFSFISCNNKESKTLKNTRNNEIKHAKGLTIITKENYSIVEVTSPWPNSKKKYSYILKKKKAVIPSEYKKLTQIQVPIKNIVLTSTTHIPSLEMLGEEKKLIGLNPLFVRSKSAIQSAIIPGNQKVKSIANQLQEKGFDVKAILSPTVPEGQERLRFCLHSYNSKEEISEVLKLLAKIFF